jgi:hypothetical protein
VSGQACLWRCRSLRGAGGLSWGGEAHRLPT